ncbi:MAG: class I SAM-dependent methyltransferase [Bacteriovoracaceae bacterium]
MDTNSKRQYIINHYKKIADSLGDNPRATMFDQTIREKEISFLRAEIERFIEIHEYSPRICDLGCGNGTTLHSLSLDFPDLSFTGLDQNEKFIEIAKKREIPNSEFLVGNLKNLEGSLHDKFDIVITERAIINLETRVFQRKAFESISNLISPGGTYLMIESFKESFDELNRMRKQLKLGNREVSKHNLYLDQKSLVILNELGLFQDKKATSPQALSHYFFFAQESFILLSDLKEAD